MSKNFSKLRNESQGHVVVVSELACLRTDGTVNRAMKKKSRNPADWRTSRIIFCISAAALLGQFSTRAQAQLAIGNGQLVNSADCGVNPTAASGAVAIGCAAAAGGSFATTIGIQSVANGTYSTALGYFSNAAANYATAIGPTAAATQDSATALGSGSQATNTYATALGSIATASGSQSVAIGPNSVASQASAVAVGAGARASDANAVALGNGSATAAAIATTGVTIGGTAYTFAGTTPGSTVSVGASGSERTVTNVAAGRISATSTDAINGSQLYATNQAISSIAASSTLHYYSVNDGGTQGTNYINDGASGTNAIASGANAQASQTAGVAVGYQSNSSGQGGVAVGSGAIASSLNSIYLGARTTAGTGATADGAVAVGTDVTASGLSSLAAGTVASASAQNAVALGAGSNASGLTALALMNGSTASGAQSIAIGATANASATHATAIGNGSQALAASTIALGDTNTVAAASGTGSIAGGNQSQVLGGTGAVALGQGQTANGNGAVAIGDPNSATGNGAVAVGANNTANGDGTVALGNGNNAQGVGSVALGNTSSALAAGAVALGNAATANNANDVALGSASTTAAAVGTVNATINGTTYTFAGTTPGSTVSVGAAGAERTITNVAAGRLSNTSTDAINGSQLFATNQAVNTVGTTVTNLGNTIATSIGGGTTYDPATGAVTTNLTYGGNTYNSVQNVLDQVGNAVDGGGIKYFHANSTLADSQATGTDSVAIGPVSTASTTNAVSIGNGATAGTNAGDVALGAGSSTGAVVATAGTTIAGNSYTYAGTTPTSTVSVGSAGNERTITNVAAGQVNANSTDAINGSQLFATDQALETLNNSVVANATHYYSVNDNGVQGGNYANNGATGVNSLAAGVGAAATADSGTALGQNTSVSVLGGVGLGSGSVSDRAIAPASGSITVGTNTIPYNTTDRNLLGAVSVGNATDFRQITNVADGTLDQDAVTLRQLKGAMSSFSVTPIKYFHANSTASDSLAAGAESVAVGPQTTVNGDNGVGIGNGAIVQQTAPGGTAIGQNATVNLADGVALGTNATSNGIQALALGAGTQAAFAGSVALGAGSVTDAPVGTTNITLNGVSYSFAGTTPGSTVSVGAAGAERTVTHVAAGRISATSTDAINGSQLYATNQSLSSLYTQFNNLSNVVNNLPPPGGTTTVNNTVQTSTDNTTPAAATGNNSTAVGAGSTASGNNSVAIGAGSVASQANTVSVGSAGNERTITNVAAGVNTTDAANVGQVNQAIQTAQNWSKDYTDQRFNSVNQDLNRLGNRANAGIASAMAMTGLGQAYQPNQSSAGVALGGFHGESGIAVGVSTVTESGRYILKLNTSTNSRGDAGISMGATMVW